LLEQIIKYDFYKNSFERTAEEEEVGQGKNFFEIEFIKMKV